MKKNGPSSPELHLISKFLEITEQTVTSGRGRTELTNEEKALIEKLAKNEASAEERNALVPLLSGNEVAMEYLTSLTNQQS